MGSLHSLIEEKGRLEALREGSFARREIEAASAYMAREGTGVEFIYSGLCQAALPHRRLPDGKGWQIISDHITLIVEPGMVGGIDSPRHIGVPAPRAAPSPSRCRDPHSSASLPPADRAK